MFKTVVGHSNDPDSESAIVEILNQCDRALSGELPQAGILLAAIDFDHAEIVQKIVSIYPEIELIGGTTDGEMSSVLGFQQDSLVLILFCSDRLQIRAGIGRRISQDFHRALEEAIAQATTDLIQPIKLCITLPEGLTSVSAVKLVDCLNQLLGKHVPIFGGLTADQWRFKQSYQFYKNEVYSDAIPILVFSGHLLLSHGLASGWNPIGKVGQVTKVEDNVVYEIDHHRALDFYYRYLGEYPPSSEYPLMVFDPTRQYSYMRAPSGSYDPTLGSVTFFGDIPEQAIVQITETTRDCILLASQASMQQAIHNYPGSQPSTILFFSCASRRQILGSRTLEEYDFTQQCLKQTLVSCGFYTNGEIAPLEQQGTSYFHNETFIALLLGEE
ncbi:MULTISPECIES: FIST signal transduction protein [unclassified Roseofilum]|uniref:FIST signal transduction protein n=1 Tax=unclassified Roseofilum TaxID=2620099 RepID=UPI000E9D5BD9|nr:MULTISPECIES: FIST N-terminal domain-containing protein [unclassified Roseofilum]MBP0010994.1 FIST C-terminal domain-containing protein [Roseofilum sp. Belize Diploria]MBP0035486.1 FIST C-terminal domain-containing protein [Roseofilum sp. Belize BBD 4]HBQ99352.1 hypothetical protein [Cyanobacteria bacterium UBA11691]